MRYKLGELISKSEVRNIDSIYGITDVRGISNNKEIQPTKANVVGRNFERFRIVDIEEFVFNRRTTRMGEKIGLGFNNTESPFIVTDDYVVFNIIDKTIVNPTYLYMFFNRSEFDRYSRFDSWGSATEFFNWEEMCDVKIDLPPLEIQEKYVAVYKSMLDNQKSYEIGLEDLKLVCDGYFDKLKKDSSLYKKLGNFIEKNELRNTDKKFSEEHVRGISNKKEFILTKADVSKTDLSKFLIIPKNFFSYNSRTDGRDMLVLAINKLDEPVIVTWNYNSFKIIDNKIQELNPDFLYAFFKRAEFDRLVRFMSWGSSQELFSWDSLCDVKIPVPDIKIQNSIAQLYNVYLERKQFNERLKQQIKSLCPILIAGAIKEANTNA